MSMAMMAKQAMPATAKPVMSVLVCMASRTNNGAQKEYASEGIAIRKFDGNLKPVVAEVLPLARARNGFEHGATSHAPVKSYLR
jgi:hypothetical protein